VSVFLCAVLSCVGRGLASGQSPVQGVLPIVYRFTSKNPSTPQGKRGQLRKKERKCSYPMLGGSLVTTAWRVTRLRMKGSPPGTESSCEYIE
jgi:hypothetical protein